MDPPTASYRYVGRTKLNPDVPPFFPSTFSSEEMPPLLDRDNRDDQERTAMTNTYSAVLQKPKPEPERNPIKSQRGILRVDPEALKDQQSQPWSRRPMPTDTIPLTEFLKLQLSSNERQQGPCTSADPSPGHRTGNMGKGSVRKEKETTKNETRDAPRGNVLDSSAPVLHKGKQRENQKKKPTRMKKTILNDRQQRLEQVTSETLPSTSEITEGEQSESAGVGRDCSEPVEGTNAVSSTNPKRCQINVTKFCDNVLSSELDESITAVVNELSRFQDRLHATDPEKARMKRRLVYGLREVHKLVKVEKVKCVIFARNIEAASGEGGLDEIVQSTLLMCQQQSVPYIFALSKIKLGHISKKHRPVSCAGILNYQGADQLYIAMLEVAFQAKRDFNEELRVNTAPIA